MSRLLAGITIAAVLIGGCATGSVGRRNGRLQAQPTPHAESETVVLLHGLGKTLASMRSLQKWLERDGYTVSNWRYWSTRGRIEEHGQRLCDFLAEVDADPAVKRIHIVGHSLGGIVARYALTIKVPTKMGRVVMLAPPNQGSAAARRLAPILGKLIKPLGQLSDDPSSDVNQLRVPEGVEIGVIAAARDGVVELENTHLRGEADHLVVPGSHMYIMNRADTRKQVVYFLQNGRFWTPAEDAPQPEIR